MHQPLEQQLQVALLRQSHTYMKKEVAEQEAIMDSNELEREREGAENPGRISRLPVGYSRETPDAGVSPLADEGTKADAQLIFISGHGGGVVIDEPAADWAGASETRRSATPSPHSAVRWGCERWARASRPSCSSIG